MEVVRVKALNIQSDAQSQRPVIYDSLDFRKFLEDMYLYFKEIQPDFSYRKFSKKAGFSSSSVLKQLVSGQSGLSKDGVKKVGKAFELSKEETSFLQKLVSYEKAESLIEQNSIYSKIMEDKAFSERHPLALAQFRYYSNWYYPLIRECIQIGATSIKEIEKNILWGISQIQIESAIKDLKSMNLVKDVKGQLVTVNEVVIAEDQNMPVQAGIYHEEMISKAIDSIRKVKSGDRDIRSATLSIDSKKIPELKKFLQETLVEALQRFEQRSEIKDAIFQLNLQAFPLFQKTEALD